MTTIPLKTCTNCHIDYPEDILVSWGVCGICVLELINKSSNVPRDRLLGDAIEAMRQEAIEWRKNHGA